MFFLFKLLQRFKFRLRLDRKNYLLKYAKLREINSILEIGVFNGNFAERLLNLVTNYWPKARIYYLGVDLFSDGLTEEKYFSEVSLYPQSLSNMQNKFSKFENVDFDLIQGDSVDVLPKIPKHKTFDIIHIDGGHSFKTVQQDWLNVSKLMNHGTAVFFDDYANARGVIKGGFGVNQVVDHIDTKIYDVKVSFNRDFFWKSYGLLILRMVKVTLKAKT